MMALFWIGLGFGIAVGATFAWGHTSLAVLAAVGESLRRTGPVLDASARAFVDQTSAAGWRAYLDACDAVIDAASPGGGIRWVRKWHAQRRAA